MAGVITPKEFSRERVQGLLRREIPKLFEELAPVAGERFRHPASLAGALAVQKIAGGEIKPVRFHSDRLQTACEQVHRRHVINFVDGTPFDVFGFIPNEIAAISIDHDPLDPPDSLHATVEKLIAPIVSRLLIEDLYHQETLAG